jgi:hypothetical protein
VSHAKPRLLPARWMLVQWSDKTVTVETQGRKTFPTCMNRLVITAFKQAAK